MLTPSCLFPLTFSPTPFLMFLPQTSQQSTCVAAAYSSLQGLRQLCPLTLLFDLADLPHRLFEDGTFVWFDVEAVDVAEVG